MHWGLVLLIVASVIACSDKLSEAAADYRTRGTAQHGRSGAMMDELHLLMYEGPFTAKQSTEVSDMMLRLSVMMKEMSRPDRERMAARHEQELQEKRRKVQEIREMIKTR